MPSKVRILPRPIVSPLESQPARIGLRRPFCEGAFLCPDDGQMPAGFRPRTSGGCANSLTPTTASQKLSPLVRELSWTHNLAIMSRSKHDEEREFYLRICVQERWSKRQLERQLSAALFERVVLSPAKLSTPLTELHPDAAAVFKDSYLVEFLDLSKEHSEADLHDGLVAKLKDFLIELGRDFQRIRPQPLRFTRTDRGISDPPAGQTAFPGQAARVLRISPRKGDVAGDRWASNQEKPAETAKDATEEMTEVAERSQAANLSDAEQCLC
jgi:predicted nuclease of restriction endonuclease-like (RecB) superfamily